MAIAGQVALVTGGGSGMGRAIAHGLAKEGCRVVIVGRTASKLEEAVRTAPGPGIVTAEVADVADAEQVARLTQTVLAKVGTPHILVNNAGVNIPNRSMQKLSLADWNYLVNVNLNGAFFLIHSLLPKMRDRRQGMIINISSVSGLRPSPLGGAAYCASKFGLVGLSGTIALEESRNGIRCTHIAPGEVETPILDARPEPVSAERRAAMLQPEDVADAVLFVAKLPARAHVPELILKPTVQDYA